MADLQSKMDSHQLDIDRAKEQIHDTTQKADSYLTELTKRVEEYEKNHSDFQPAGAYLKSALDASRSATQKLKTQGQDLSERSVPVAIDGMSKVRDSLDDLQKQAVEYDNKYAASSGQQSIDTLHHWVNSGRQHATDALEMTNEQLMKLRDAIGNMAGQAAHGAQVVVGEAVRAAEYGDEKLGVSDKAGGVVQKVRELDARLGVSATAVKVDSKVTGGLGCKVAATTVDMVTESVNYISETLQNARLAAQQSSTAQDVESKAAAATGAVAAKKNEIQETAAEGVQRGKEMVGMTKEKTEEKVGMAAEKASETKEMAVEKAGQTKEMIKDKAGDAKDKTGEAVETTKEKASEVTETVKEKAGMAKEKTTDTAGQAKDAVQDKAYQAKDKTEQKAGNMKEQAKGAIGQAADKADDAKEKVGSAAETAKGAGTQMESSTTEDTTTEKQSAAKTKAAAGTTRKEKRSKNPK
ncbi:unnamed protein product [Phytophthora fragariaefolia]|uniref:Unnamed protein product n=1 Tax=Phytophthora fragariaefolia TaxID=1490495 RepID=A0A9W7D371_9STRA|nr:unnamed protein product [Phytophthora fragariaefolia]